MTRAQEMRDILVDWLAAGEGARRTKAQFARLCMVQPRAVSRWLQQAQQDDKVAFLMRATARSGRQPGVQVLELARRALTG